MNMPVHYRSSLETMDVITRPKVSDCVCWGGGDGEGRSQMWLQYQCG